VSILNAIIGVIAFSFFSIIVLPIALVIFFLGIAGLAANVGEHKNLGIPKSCRSSLPQSRRKRVVEGSLSSVHCPLLSGCGY
jgi:hypothetical protein